MYMYNIKEMLKCIVCIIKAIKNNDGNVNKITRIIIKDLRERIALVSLQSCLITW